MAVDPKGIAGLPIEFAIIGPGRMGEIYARVIEQTAMTKLVAIVGNREATTNALAKRYDVAAYCGGDCQTLLDNHPALRAAIIATPEWEHVQPAVAMVSNGIDVLLEKPLAHSVSDADLIVNAANGSGVSVMLCHSVRFDPRFSQMREAVRSGLVGAVRLMNSRRNADSSAARRILGNLHPAYWLAPHDIDIMRWVSGAEVIEVGARWVGTGSDRNDGLVADLRFDNGCLGHIENTWITPPLNTGCRNGMFDAFGEDGVIEVSEFEQGVTIHRAGQTVQAPDTTQAVDVHGSLVGAVPNLVMSFIDVLFNDQQVVIGLDDGLTAVKVAGGIEQALVSGSPVTLI